MTDSRFDVVALGNAVVDVLASTSDDFLAAEGLVKGSMRLISAEQATDLYSRMGPGQEVSGGSAANTLAGLAALGQHCGFIGQVAEDQLGEVFAHDMRSVGITFDTPPRAGPPSTGRVLILVAPDGERTMSTALGAAHYLLESALNTDMVANCRYLLIEGYLWDPPEPRAAIRKAMAITKAAGGQVVFALSALFLLDLYRDDFIALIDEGTIDVLFCNEEEVAALMPGKPMDAVIEELSAKVPTLVITMSERGAMAVQGGVRAQVPAEPVARVVDTTGAGDTFTSGFLAGQLQGRSLEDSLTMGAICAAECISHIGPRPREDLKALVAARIA
jgi:sugar/nucleoside kinase (ribokinase family)